VIISSLDYYPSINWRESGKPISLGIWARELPHASQTC